jgi:hypothetical protein
VVHGSMSRRTEEGDAAMSYTVHHIAAVPRLGGDSYYVFVLENPDSKVRKLDHDEFERMGHMLGEASAIVRGYDETFCTDAIHAYFGEARARGDDWEDYPTLLVTDVHPDDLMDARKGEHPGGACCLVPLGRLGPRDRDAYAVELCKAIKDGVAVPDLQMQLRKRVLGTPLQAAFKRASLGFSLGPVAFSLPSASDITGH